MSALHISLPAASPPPATVPSTRALLLPADTCRHLATTTTLQHGRYPWHPRLAIFEHEHFFFQLYLAGQKVMTLNYAQP